MSTILWTLFGLFFVSFLLIVLRGAPFVPTRHRDLDDLFSFHRFKKSEVLVDLGSGDGRVLRAAAERGIHAVGYELNPFLALASRLWLRRYGERVRVHLADFWTVPLPDTTVVVFVFLADPFMKKLDLKLQQEATRLGHDIVLVSYGSLVPTRSPEATRGGFTSYRYKA